MTRGQAPWCRARRSCTAAGLAVLAGLLSYPPPTFADSLPQYMESWEYGINIDEDEGPSYFADLLFPLSRGTEEADVLFLEPRVSYRESEWLTNLGWGYRRLVGDRTWLLGANMFYDYESQYSHYRLGWGVEALSAYAEFRSNYYLGLSQERLVEESAAGNVFEKAVDGFDVEAGLPIPYYSRLKLFGGFNWYNFETFKNRYGWTLRAEYKPFPLVVLDGLVSNDTKSNLDWGMTVAFRIPLGGAVESESWQAPWRLDETAFPESDASEFLYSLVERHHEIVVERRRVTGSMTVEVKRGT